MGRLNKKGQEIFAIIMYPVFVMLLFSSIYVVNKLDNSSASVGDVQLEIKEIYEKAENDLFFLDQAAIYSHYHSAHILAENGGFQSPECGSYLTYNLWNSKAKNCYPDHKKNFEGYFDRSMDTYYTSSSLTNPEYHIQVINNTVIAIAKSTLNYSIPQATYAIYPSLSSDINYSITEYDDLIIHAKDLVRECSLKTDIEGCITANKPHQWNLGSCEGNTDNDGNNFRFCIESKSYPYHKASGNQNIQYKFALFFE